MVGQNLKRLSLTDSPWKNNTNGLQVQPTLNKLTFLSNLLGKLSTERYAMAFILEKDNFVTEILIWGKNLHSHR